MPKKRAAFEQVIRYRFAGYQTPFPSGQPNLLASGVRCEREKGTQKRSRQYAKAIVDAVKNILFGDDRQIDLNIIRIKS